MRGAGRDANIERLVSNLFNAVEAIYANEAAKAAAAGKASPSLLEVFPKIKTVVEMRIDQQ